MKRTSLVCPELGCGKVFRRKEHLNRHERMHNDSRPYECPMCSRSFGRSDVLKRHVDQHLKGVKTNKAAIACDRCRRRKTRCDGNDPCARCEEANSGCWRKRSLPLPPSSSALTTTPSLTVSGTLDETSLNNLSKYRSYSKAGGPQGIDIQSSSSTRDDSSNRLDLVQEIYSTATENLSLYATGNSVSSSIGVEDSTPRTREESAAVNPTDNPIMDIFNLGLQDDDVDRIDGSTFYHDPSAFAFDNAAFPPYDLSILNSRKEDSHTRHALQPGRQGRTLSEGTAQMASEIEETNFSELSNIDLPGFSNIDLLNQQKKTSEMPAIDHNAFLSTDSRASADAEDDTPPFHLTSTANAVIHPHFINRYFTSFHLQWPILHRELFLRSKPPFILQCAVGLIGALLDKDSSIHTSALELHKWSLNMLCATALKFVQEPTKEITRESRLCKYQALLLNVILAFYVGEDRLISTARIALANLVVCIKNEKFFRIQHIIFQDNPRSSPKTRWAIREQKKRLVFAAFICNCYLCLLDDHPPQIRFEEMLIPFPCTEAVWEAPCGEWPEAVSREPRSRQDATFHLQCCWAISQTKRIHPLLFQVVDHACGLYAMQARLWEEVRQMHENGDLGGDSTQRNNTIPHPFPGYGWSWIYLLDIWRSRMEERRKASDVCFYSALSEQETYFTSMMVYHLSYLRIYADLTLIRELADSSCGNDHTPHMTRRLETRVLAWTKSISARHALWHAAQMLELYLSEVPKLQESQVAINPITTCALFHAGLIDWVYVRSSFLCGLCSASDLVQEEISDGSSASDIVCELTTADCTSEDYVHWAKNGGQASIRGLFLCACHMPRSLGLYEDAIQINTVSSGLSQSYTQTLADLKSRR